MKPAAILLVLASAFHPARAEILTTTEREALLQKLEAMRANADAKVDARYRAAIAAYQSAMSSNEAAIALYLNCVEKVNFKDQQRKSADFREWKRREDEKLSDPGMGLALRIQLRWLILCLRAASENADRAQLVTSAREVVDAIVNDADKLINQRQILNQSAVGSLFARAYDIGDVQVDNWVFSPGQIDEIYDKILLPPLRAARQAEPLRNAWLRRISHATRMQEFLPTAEREPGEKRRIGMASAMTTPDLERFKAVEVPQMMWDMEMDLFCHGDERNAAVRMLAHLEKNLGHPSARDWAADFTKLLTGEVKAAKAPTESQSGS